jgi:tetratricopeptide (TPR) repeat protein
VEACPPSSEPADSDVPPFAAGTQPTAGIIAAALVAATAVSTWRAVQANADRRLADERLDNERKTQNTAATDAAMARAVNDFLRRDLLGQVNTDPQFRDEISGNTNLTVKEALDRAAAKIGTRYQDEPLVEAAIRVAIADAYRSVSQQKLAVPHLERALTLRQTYLDPDHPDTLACMSILAQLYANRMGRFQDSITARQHIVKKRTALLGPNHPDTLGSVHALAEAYMQAGRWDISVPLLEQLLVQHRTLFGATDSSTLATMHTLARNYTDVHRFNESVALHEKVLDLLGTSDDPERGLWESITLARTCQNAGNLDRADQLFRKVLVAVRKQTNSHRSRNRMANVSSLLARNLLLQHRYLRGRSFGQICCGNR